MTGVTKTLIAGGAGNTEKEDAERGMETLTAFNTEEES